MKQLSNWASVHRAGARTIIISCHLLLNAAGILLAVFLFDDKAIGASWLVAAFIALTISAAMAYPAKGVAGNYWRRKRCDVALVLATLLFAVGNTAITLRPASPGFVAGEQATAAYRIKHAETDHAAVIDRLSGLRADYQLYDTAAKIIICILIVGCAIVAGVLIAGQACSIGWGGSEALATVVLVLGWGGILAGGFFLFRRTLRGPRWKKLRPGAAQ